MGSFRNSSSTGKDVQPLTIEQCREMLCWDEASDEQVQEFLNSLRLFLDQFLDDYFSGNHLADRK